MAFPVTERGRTWVYLGIVVALLGVVVSAYATHHHLQLKALGATDAVCNINQTFNCDEIAKSKFSEIQGIPVAIFGLGYFIAQLVLLGFGFAGGKSAKEHMQGYVAMVLIGVITSIALGAIAALSIGAVCPTCMGVYAITLIQAAGLFIFRQELPRPFSPKEIFSGGATAAIAVVAVILAFNFLKPSISPAAKSADESTPTIDEPTVIGKVEDIPVTRSAYAGLGEDYRKGPDTAKVQIIEFADFECPACRQVKTILDTLTSEYGDKIQLVFRNFPLDNSCNSSVHQKMHEFACRAAVMGRCAGLYGKFWDMYSAMYERQRDMNNETLKNWAKDVGLTDEQINNCIASKDIQAKLNEDIDLAMKLNIDSTPTLFINGRKVVGGKGLNEMRAAIDPLLN